MRLKLLTSLVLAMFTTGVFAAPPLRYRITPIPAPSDGSITVTGLNNRGEVVGTRTSESTGEQRGYIWRNGTFTDIDDLIGADVTQMEALDINNRSQIVGYFSDPVTLEFRGFWLDGNVVTYLDGPPDSTAVFANVINDREVILGASYDTGGNENWWFWDEGTYTPIDPSFSVTGFNRRGVVTGTWSGPQGNQAALWDDGVITPIAAAPSTGGGINDRGQLIIRTGPFGASSELYVWDKGTLTFLPKLRENQINYFAGPPNRRGLISGTTVYNEPSGTKNLATLWIHGEPVALDSLIHPADPLKPYVTLGTASINDRNQILASGHDSRSPFVAYFFLTPVR